MPSSSPAAPRPAAPRQRSRAGGAARWTGAAALALAPLVALAPSASAASPSTAYIRVAHLVPGFGAVTMSATLTSFDGRTTPLELTPSASYGAVSSYRALPVGTYAIAVRPVGAAASTPPALTATLNAQAGGAYTVAGLGSKDAPRIQPITDQIARPAAGHTEVRVINAAVPGQSADVAVAGGAPIASGAAFASPTSYTDVASGSVHLTATAGSRSTTADVDLESGDDVSLLLLDDGKGGVSVRPVVDASGPSTVPVGGAQTGAGGLAAGRVDVPLALAGASTAAAAVAVGAAGALVRRRRARTAAAGAGR